MSTKPCAPALPAAATSPAPTRTMQGYPQIELAGATDVFPERARSPPTMAAAYATLEEMLADPAIDLVVNLTIHHAHPAVITQCLEAGKHVHSEKPLAMTYAEAKGLVDLAARAAAAELLAHHLHG